jgi:hypothetical protein
MALKKTLEDVYRIFDAIEPDEYGCKNWPRKDGLVGFHFQVQLNGKKYGVHRLALERKLGRVLGPGMQALHDCDWRSCVNEDHLYEGTYSDNMFDRGLRQPGSWDFLRDPNSQARLKMKAWQQSPEGRAHLQKIGEFAKARGGMTREQKAEARKRWQMESYKKGEE